MHTLAIKKAISRLSRAGECIRGMHEARNGAVFESNWADFLIALNGIPTILEQGAKSSPQCRQWYGQKKALGRKDSLLRYLHQARNAHEHGLLEITRKDRLYVEIVFDENDKESILKVEFGNKGQSVTFDAKQPYLGCRTDAGSCVLC